MKSHLTLVSTLDMDRETWLAYRYSGLGASEVPPVLGWDDFMSSIELYYLKIGDTRRLDTENIYQFMGRQHEDLIADLWTYWDGDEESMITNCRAGNVVRKCTRVNAFVRNPKYPWLYVSLDRRINKHGKRDEGTLEIKNIGGWEMDKWEFGLPPKFLIQVNTQMAVCEFLYGELAMLEDGRRFHVLPFDVSDTIVGDIMKRTKEFWDRVVAGRKLVNEKYDAMLKYNQKRVQECEYEIDKLAPEPDGSPAYLDYLKKRFNNPSLHERRGLATELSIARRHLKLVEKIKAIEADKREAEAELKLCMKETQILDFGNDGRVYWTVQQKGGRVFRNKLGPE